MIRQGVVVDVEIVLDVKNNYYFSLNMFLENTSWVREIHFIGLLDKKIKRIEPLLNNRKEIMNKKMYNQTNDYLVKF